MICITVLVYFHLCSYWGQVVTSNMICILLMTDSLFFMSAAFLLVYLFIVLFLVISQISLIIIGWFRSENCLLNSGRNLCGRVLENFNIVNFYRLCDVRYHTKIMLAKEKLIRDYPNHVTECLIVRKAIILAI